MFYVASIAKQFTAAAIATLMLNGAMSVDDSIRQWIPALDAPWDAVRIEHLLSHTGGLPDSNTADDEADWGVDSSFTTWDRVAVIAQPSPSRSPERCVDTETMATSCSLPPRES